LHEIKNDFLEAIQATSQNMGIREVYIEKDYWVTFALRRLSESVLFSNITEALDEVEKLYFTSMRDLVFTEDHIFEFSKVRQTFEYICTAVIK
jgi:hypothetical protein